MLRFSVAFLIVTYFTLINGQCGPPPTITNGASDSAPATSDEGDEIIYTCSEGYEFASEDSTTFTATCTGGSWPTIVGCDLVNCDALSAETGEITPANQYTYGSTVAVSCNANRRIPHLPVGDTASITCQANGTWSNWDDSVTDACVDIVCPTITDSSGDSTDFTPGAPAVNFLCDEGHIFDELNDGTLVEDKTLTCTAQGEWTDGVTTGWMCNALECVDLATTYGLNHVTLSPDSNLVGARVKIACQPGHEFNDSSIEKFSTCWGNRTWSFAPYDCEPRLCSAVKNTSNSIISTFNNEYDTEVNYTCIDGFFFPDGATSRVAYCNQYGKWTENIPDCTDTLVDIDTGFKEVIVNSENAVSVGAITLGIMGVIFLAILIFDIITFPRQFQFLKRNIVSRFTCCQEDKDTESELDSLDGDTLMRQSVISLGRGRITPAPSTVDLQLPDKSKGSSLNNVPELEEVNEVVEEELKKPAIPRTRLLSARNTIQRALDRALNANRFVRSVTTKQKNQFKSTTLPLGADNYGKVIEPRPPSPEKEEEEDDDDSSEYTDDSEEEEEATQ